METSKNDNKNILSRLKQALGFYRNPPYIEDELKEADVSSAMYLSAIVGLIEIAMILRYVRNWVLPGKVATIGIFFNYTQSYWELLAASLLLFIYCRSYLSGKLKSLKKFSSLFIFAYFLIGMYFGITTGQYDFSRGRMIICFLTMLMWATIICVWRPFSSVMLVCGFGSFFVWLLNNRTFDKAGNPLQLSEGDYINYVTFLIVLFILEIAVYSQRYSDAKKSWRLQLISVTDDLTGIPNVRKFVDDSKIYLEKCFAADEHPIFLVMTITNFQTYNDRFNYSGGDRLLIDAGQIILSEFPDEPVAREYGGTFLALTNSKDYIDHAANIRSKIKALHPHETYLDVRIGAYRPQDPHTDPRHAIDHARFAAKDNPKNDDFLIEYDEKMSKDYKLKQYVLNNVDEAVKKGYIRVYYQPVVWSEDGTLAGCEALARWIDPTYGFLSPGVFIPTLEEGREIHQLDLCIYETVCRNIRENLDKGLPVLPASLNFSRLDFELMDAVEELEKLVAKYQIPKEYLHVEITESAITNDVAALKMAVNKLHESGYEVWLDDFGSGYSSLNVLKDFDFDLLKIDMEFLKNFSGNANSRTIISNVIDLAEKLNMQTLAEGVESQDAVNFLKKAGCGRMQGYYYGKPMPYEDLLAEIEKGNLRLKGSK